jgi:hypothetical protein
MPATLPPRRLGAARGHLSRTLRHRGGSGCGPEIGPHTWVRYLTRPLTEVPPICHHATIVAVAGCGRSTCFTISIIRPARPRGAGIGRAQFGRARRRRPPRPMPTDAAAVASDLGTNRAGTHRGRRSHPLSRRRLWSSRRLELRPHAFFRHHTAIAGRQSSCARTATAFRLP